MHNWEIRLHSVLLPYFMFVMQVLINYRFHIEGKLTFSHGPHVVLQTFALINARIHTLRTLNII
jgi:hypothetical protein